MRNPNGYGSVVKLSGRRRKPFMVRKTAGYTDKGYPIYTIIGYAVTRAEGNMMLAEYNRNPYDVDATKVTVAEVFESWEKGSRLSPNYLKVLRSAYNRIGALYDVPYKDLRLMQMQDVVNQCAPATQRFVKCLFSSLDEYAKQNDIIDKGYAEFITTVSVERDERQPFTEDEIDRMWDHADDDMIAHGLILIYTGWRISEYLALTFDPEAATMKGGMKTTAGKNRIVPVHHRILPLVLRLWNGKTMYAQSVTHFRETFYIALSRLDIKHVIHETRHTFETRLDNAGVNTATKNKLIGHAGGGVGEIVYTHKTLDQLREAVESLR